MQLFEIMKAQYKVLKKEADEWPVVYEGDDKRELIDIIDEIITNREDFKDDLNMFIEENIDYFKEIDKVNSEPDDNRMKYVCILALENAIIEALNDNYYLKDKYWLLFN